MCAGPRCTEVEAGCYVLQNGQETEFAQFRYLYQYLCLHNEHLNETRWRTGSCAKNNPGNVELF